MEKKSVRNTNIEILRFILMIAIFTWHVLVHGYNLKYLGDQHIEANNIQLILCALFSPATYCFMFISGYYGITYSNKRLLYIVYLLFFTMTCSCIIRYLTTSQITNLTLFPLTKGPCWFIYWYLIIMTLSPILNEGIYQINKKQFKVILIIMLYFLIISMVKFKINNGSNFFGLLTMYLLARYIMIYKIKFTIKWSYILFFLSLTILSLILIILYHSYDGNLRGFIFIFLSYCNPLIIIMAVTLFFIFLNLKPRHNEQINKILSPLLIVYLLTEFLGYEGLYKYIVGFFNSSIFYGIGIIISFCLFSIIMGHLANKIFNLFFKNKL